MDIIKKRSRRDVKRQIEPSLSQQPGLAGPAAGTKPKKRRVLKKLLVAFLVVFLLGLGALIGTYFYIKSAPIGGAANGRTNIMVLGVDSAAKLSDTIMIVSLDSSDRSSPKLAMISLPRDLYVEIPEFGGSKINAAYSYGVNNDYPGGGVALATKTLETNFDLPIHHYAVLDFNSFRDLVDAVGGVDIEVKEAISDPFFPKPDYSGVVEFNISEGTHHMDGELALKYARSRYTTSDFDRAARQQQVILAIKDKIMSPGMLLDPSKLQRVNEAIEQNITTDLSWRQLAKLYLIFREIKPGGVTRHVIDSTNYLVPAGFGTSAYVPRTGDFDEINKFIDDIFSQSTNTLPEAQAN